LFDPQTYNNLQIVIIDNIYEMIEGTYELHFASLTQFFNFKMRQCKIVRQF